MKFHTYFFRECLCVGYGALCRPLLERGRGDLRSESNSFLGIF